MEQLAKRLEPYGQVTNHDWNDPGVVPAIGQQSKDDPIVVIGFSLGANQLGWINDKTGRRIQLGVAYDPSRQSPLVGTSEDGRPYTQTATHYDRLLCYYNPGTWIYGGSRYVGSNVETTHIDMPHLSVQFSEALHTRTIAAVRSLKGDK